MDTFDFGTGQPNLNNTNFNVNVEGTLNASDFLSTYLKNHPDTSFAISFKEKVMEPLIDKLSAGLKIKNAEIDLKDFKNNIFDQLNNKESAQKISKKYQQIVQELLNKVGNAVPKQLDFKNVVFSDLFRGSTKKGATDPFAQVSVAYNKLVKNVFTKLQTGTKNLQFTKKPIDVFELPDEAQKTQKKKEIAKPTTSALVSNSTKNTQNPKSEIYIEGISENVLQLLNKHIGSSKTNIVQDTENRNFKSTFDQTQSVYLEDISPVLFTKLNSLLKPKEKNEKPTKAAIAADGLVESFMGGLGEPFEAILAGLSFNVGTKLAGILIRIVGPALFIASAGILGAAIGTWIDEKLGIGKPTTTQTETSTLAKETEATFGQLPTAKIRAEMTKKHERELEEAENMFTFSNRFFDDPFTEQVKEETIATIYHQIEAETAISLREASDEYKKNKATQQKQEFNDMLEQFGVDVSYTQSVVEKTFLDKYKEAITEQVENIELPKPTKATKPWFIPDPEREAYNKFKDVYDKQNTGPMKPYMLGLPPFFKHKESLLKETEAIKAGYQRPLELNDETITETQSMSNDAIKVGKKVYPINDADDVLAFKAGGPVDRLLDGMMNSKKTSMISNTSNIPAITKLESHVAELIKKLPNSRLPASNNMKNETDSKAQKKLIDTTVQILEGIQTLNTSIMESSKKSAEQSNQKPYAGLDGFPADSDRIRDPAYASRSKVWEKIRGDYITA